MRWRSLLVAMMACSAAAEPQPDVHEFLEAFVPEKLRAMDIPGTAIAVVQRGRPTLLAGFGTVDPTSGEPVDPSRHVFRVGSVSKPLAAATVLRVFKGEGVDLHADLRAELSDLPVRPPLTQALTMHHLLTHTAGFNERLFGQHLTDPARFLDLDGYLRAHLPARFIEPGRLIAYNDHHTMLAAWVVERLTQTSFAELAERLLLSPLGMTATTFRQLDQPESIAGNRVLAWHRSGDRLRAYEPDLVMSTAAAGAWSTAGDMAVYVQALLDCSESRLEGAVCSGQLQRQAANHARLPGRTYGLAEGSHGALRLLFKDGQASGFNARLLLVPEHGLGMFVVHNRNILGRFGDILPAGRFGRETTAAVLELLYPMEHRQTPAPEPMPGAVERAARYAGDYRNAVAARHSWERIIGMFDDVHVAATARGVDFGFGEFVEIEPGVMQWHRGGDNYRIFGMDGERAGHVFIGGGAYERIPWYVASWFTPWFVLGVVAWFFFSCVAGARGLRGATCWLVIAPGVALLGFSLGFVTLMALTDVQVFFRGATPELLALLALPLIGGAGLLAQMPLSIAGRGLGRAWRLMVGANLLIGAVFLAWLEYWNLLGYRLG